VISQSKSSPLPLSGSLRLIGFSLESPPTAFTSSMTLPNIKLKQDTPEYVRNNVSSLDEEKERDRDRLEIEKERDKKERYDREEDFKRIEREIFEKERLEREELEHIGRVRIDTEERRIVEEDIENEHAEEERLDLERENLDRLDEAEVEAKRTAKDEAEAEAEVEVEAEAKTEVERKRIEAEEESFTSVKASPKNEGEQRQIMAAQREKKKKPPKIMGSINNKTVKSKKDKTLSSEDASNNIRSIRSTQPVAKKKKKKKDKDKTGKKGLEISNSSVQHDKDPSESLAGSVVSLDVEEIFQPAKLNKNIKKKKIKERDGSTKTLTRDGKTSSTVLNQNEIYTSTSNEKKDEQAGDSLEESTTSLNVDNIFQASQSSGQMIGSTQPVVKKKKKKKDKEKTSKRGLEISNSSAQHDIDPSESLAGSVISLDVEEIFQPAKLNKNMKKKKIKEHDGSTKTLTRDDKTSSTVLNQNEISTSNEKKDEQAGDSLEKSTISLNVDDIFQASQSSGQMKSSSKKLKMKKTTKDPDNKKKKSSRSVRDKSGDLSKSLNKKKVKKQKKKSLNKSRQLRESSSIGSMDLSASTIDSPVGGKGILPGDHHFNNDSIKRTSNIQKRLSSPPIDVSGDICSTKSSIFNSNRSQTPHHVSTKIKLRNNNITVDPYQGFTTICARGTDEAKGGGTTNASKTDRSSNRDCLTKLAGIYSKMDERTEFNPPYYEKTPLEKKLIRKSFRQNFAFSDLTPSQLDPMVGAFEKVKYQKGEIIAKQGNPDCFFYIIQDGEVGFDSDGDRVAGGVAGDAFGQMALVYSCDRSTTVTAEEDETALLRLHQSNFVHIRRQQISRSISTRMALLNKIPFFKYAEEIDLIQLSAGMEAHAFDADDNLSASFKDSPFCLIQEGSVTSFADGSINGPGFSYGEDILSRTSTVPKVLALTDGVAYTIDRQNFEKLFGDMNRLIVKFQTKEILRNIPTMKASDLSATQLDTLVRQISDKPFAAGEDIFTDTENTTPSLYIVRKGKVKITRKNGKEDIVTTGCYFGHECFVVSSSDSQDYIPTQVKPKYNATSVEESVCGVLTLQEFASVFGKECLGVDIGKGNQIQLDDLKRHRVLGEGYFGTVWLVTNTKSMKTKPYALKIQYFDDNDKKAADKIRKEISIMRKLHHPFVVKLINTYEEEDNITMLLSLAPGGELFDRIHYKLSNGLWESGLGEEQGKFYCSIVADTLSFMHVRGYIYRDLKPENILIGSDGYVSVVHKLPTLSLSSFITVTHSFIFSCDSFLFFLLPTNCWVCN
ncbi:MAG: CRP-like cAMP-binding protein, partial [Bacillariaceae sp.]